MNAKMWVKGSKFKKGSTVREIIPQLCLVGIAIFTLVKFMHDRQVMADSFVRYSFLIPMVFVIATDLMAVVFRITKPKYKSLYSYCWELVVALSMVAVVCIYMLVLVGLSDIIRGNSTPGCSETVTAFYSALGILMCINIIVALKETYPPF